MSTQKDLPIRQRDQRLTQTEQELLEKHYGLIRAVAYSFRSARIPDLESELALHACRTMPSYTAPRPFGPWLKAVLSRYCLNLIRNNRQHQRVSTETDQCAGGVNDILSRIQSRESQPDDLISEVETVIESWGDQSTATASPTPEPKPEADPAKARRSNNARAMRWVSKHAALLGQWRGLQWYASLAGVPTSSMRRALKLKGYVQPSRKARSATVQPSLFQEV